MQSQFIAAINQIAAEKNLPKEVIMETIEAAFKTAYKKDYGTKDQELVVELSEGGENPTIFLKKIVVEEVEMEDTEMTLAEAKKLKKTAKVGDEILIDVTPMEYGRIAAQAAKQVIIQKLQEAERNIMYETFKDRENELINAQVHRVQNDHVYIDLGKITLELPRDHKIPGERYYAGQRLKLFLDKVMKTTRGPRLIISRTHPGLVQKLLELEIPEVTQGIVVVNKIARDPGMRCKIAVSSNDPKVDPVGACVGQKGVRIQALMDELNGERIDVIPFTDNMVEFIKQSLAPAKLSYLDINEEEERVKIYVEDDQRPLAIGRKGQNVRLASKLTGLEIDIMDVAELSEDEKKGMVNVGALEAKAKLEANKEAMEESEEEAVDEKMLSDLGLDTGFVEALENAGLTLVSQLKGLSADDLKFIEGLGDEGAEQVFDAVKNA